MDKSFAQRLHSDTEGEFNPKAVTLTDTHSVNPAEIKVGQTVKVLHPGNSRSSRVYVDHVTSYGIYARRILKNGAPSPRDQTWIPLGSVVAIISRPQEAGVPHA